MSTTVLVGFNIVIFVGGVIIGRKYEQKAVAKVLAEFARVDAATKSLVNRCYSRLSDGIKKELLKLAAL